MSLDYQRLGVLFTIGLIKNLREAKFRNNLIPFWKIDEEFRKRGLDYEQQIIIMKILASLGFFELITFNGWRLIEQEPENCWDYTKIEG